MPDVISNTSPLQYLHQLGLLHVLPSLAGRVWVPPAVVAELAAGREAGLNLPDPAACGWITVKGPSCTSSLPPVTGLGNGEREVLLFVSGRPLKEPVAWYGPIVMNTEEELRIAFEEFQKGTFIK